LPRFLVGPVVAAAVAALVFVFLPAAPARAETRCPVPAGMAPSLGALDGMARLQWIDASLAKTAHRAQLWTWGWGIGIVVSTGLNLIPLAFVPPDERVDWYTSSATTIIGLVPLIIAPLDVVGDSRVLRAHIGAPPQPPGTQLDVCGLLAEAETMLVRNAKNQADGQRWWLHAGNVLLNTGVGLFLGIGFHHWKAGAYNAVVGSAIGEAIILTQPTGSVDALEKYRAGAISDGGGGDGARPVSALTYRWAF
jgi:hypothetical protein